MKQRILNLKSIFRAEQVRPKAYYDLESYHNELKYTSELLKSHAIRVTTWRVEDEQNRAAFNSEFKELMAEIVERGEVPMPRREAVKEFYADSIEKFPDPKDRMIFIQGIAAIDGGEFLDLLDMYQDDFNAALIKYKEMTEDDE